ncbi:MAG: zinc-binding dehydrogenase [Pseudomonadales bacterium]
MKLVQLHGPGSFSLDEVALPQISDDDALIQVQHCGICGSDVTYVAQGGLAGPSGAAMPLGHELSGTVAAVGKNVIDLAIGDRVCVNPMGAGNAIGNGGSEGGFARQLLVRNAALGGCVFKLPETVSMLEGALVEPLAVGFHAVNQAQPGSGNKVLIFGLGAIGLSCIAALRYRGVEDIIGLDFSADRRERAMKMGARETRSPEGLDLLAYLQQQHGADQLMGMLPIAGTDIFIDAAGATSIVKSVLDVCKTGARLIVAGLHKKPVEVDFTMLLMKELSITGSMAYPNEFPDVISMLASGEVDVLPMVSHHFPLEEFETAFGLACAPEAGAKIMIDLLA